MAVKPARPKPLAPLSETRIVPVTAIQTTFDPTAALRAAIVAETRIAEALAQRSRSVVDTVDSLARRALGDAVDIADARRRLDVVTRSLREGLAAGEMAEAGDLRRLAETTLAAFDFGAGPRISIEGPAAVLAPEARQLVALALFDLASRSQRFGALADPLGRVSLEWRMLRSGAMRLTWMEFGAPAGARGMRRGAGGPLLELLRQRFGGPLRVHATPSGLTAELTLPVGDITVLAGPSPRRALVALRDTTAALTIAALLYALGVGDVLVARDARDAAEALSEGRVDLVVTDDAEFGACLGNARPATILVLGAGTAVAAGTGPVLRLPANASDLTAALIAAVGPGRAAAV